jgi:hypothetical protein
MSDQEEPSSGTVSSSCSNPECQYIVEQYNGISKKVEHELWRAGQAVNRARALRVCAGFVLYCVAVFHLVFSDSILARAGAVAMLGLCIKAIHTEG